jgi:hypothetical protein
VLDHSTQSGRHAYAERGNDRYPTTPGAARALLLAETVPHFAWDPCCGTGTIVGELRAGGHEVVATDITSYGIPVTCPGYFNVDFLLEQQAPARCEAVICNPPYRHAPAFVRHAIKLVPFVAMLLRLAFLESVSRTDILEHSGLSSVLVFRKRLPMMHRHGWDGPRASNSIAFAWFVWRRDWCGNPQIKRIDRA